MELQGVNISEPRDCSYAASDGPFAITMFSLQCVLIPLSVFGNLAVVVVVSSYRSSMSAIDELIRALAFFDMCYAVCLSTFVFYYEYHYIGASDVDYSTVGRLVIAFVPLSYTFQTLSYWTVAAIAANRYNAVCRPTETLAANTVRRARVTVAAMTAAAIAYSTPSYVEHWAWPGTTSLCYGYVVYVNNTLIQSDAYKYGYGLAASVVADYLGPFCVAAFCSFHVVRTLLRTRGEASLVSSSLRSGGGDFGDSGAAAGRRQIAERRLSVMMLVTSAVFMVCVWADALDKVLWRLQSDWAPKFYLVQTVFSLANASTDFLIYATMNRKFRETLCCLRSRRRRSCRRQSSGAAMAIMARIPMTRLWSDGDELSGGSGDATAAAAVTSGSRSGQAVSHVEALASGGRSPNRAPRHSLAAAEPRRRESEAGGRVAWAAEPTRQSLPPEAVQRRMYSDTRRRLAAIAVVLVVSTFGRTAPSQRLSRALARISRTR